MSKSKGESVQSVIHVSRMTAAPGDPWLSVHSIAEYAFCPRAGLIAYENRRTDEEEEVPSLYTLPQYELHAIESGIHERWQRLRKWVWLIVLSAGLSVAGTVFRQYALLAIFPVAMGICTVKAANIASEMFALYRRLDLAEQSRCAEPIPASDQIQPVNWFGMLHLGFDSIRLQEPLPDSTWYFTGRPWRILRRGSLYIPVYQTHSAVEKLSDSQKTKIVAYCRLCELTYGENSSPYGIVLTGEDHSGFAVPNHPSFRKRFHDSLVELRHLAILSNQHLESDVPFDSRKCAHCPLAKPRKVSWGRQIQRLGAPVAVNPLGENHRGLLHCDCGDRFRWRPAYTGE
jgi:hypothetical protein